MIDGRKEYRFDPDRVTTPCYLVDEGLLRANLEILADIKARTGCRILLALKCFSMFRVFPLLAGKLDGVCASSPFEARLGYEEFDGEVHAFGAAYSDSDLRDLCRTSDHILFNSMAQLERQRPLVQRMADRLGKTIEIGIRINPMHSEGALEIYDPCSPGSRLGIRRSEIDPEKLRGVTGLHWHNLCEQNSDSLARTIRAVESRFGDIIPGMRYVNFGGGHHITRADYDRELLVREIRRFREKWQVEVYLEPGEAVALNTGYLVASVLDVVETDELDVVIMDSSVPAHMPDVLEMPYRPEIVGCGETADESRPYLCRVGGLSCLAGDLAGVYSFPEKPRIGQRLVFTDMAIYTMVKNNTFNGIGLPAIYLYTPEEDRYECVRRFGYSDFKSRLS